MPIFQKLINLEEVFENLPYPPVIINNLEGKDNEEREQISNIVSTYYTSDNVSLIPTCGCGSTKGVFSVNTICPNCNMEVLSPIESNIYSLLWVNKPEGIDKLISPIILIMLKERFTKSGFSVMNYLMDTSYRVKSNSKAARELLTKVREQNFDRGYNNFITNFDSIIEVLLGMKEFRLKYGVKDSLKELILRDRDKIFTNHLPLPNRNVLIIEKTPFGVSTDKIVIMAIDAIQMLTGIDNLDTIKPMVKQNRTFRSLDLLCGYYSLFFKEKLNQKRRIFRGHVYGTRTNLSGRAVVTNLVGHHDYNDIHLPWGVSLVIFRPYLINKLMRLGYSHNGALNKIFTAINIYDEVLDGILKSLYSIPGEPLYFLIGRNPSLLQGSILRMKLGKIKTDPRDPTLSLNILNTRSLNADYDGDAIYFSLCPDKIMKDLMYPFDPKFNMLLMDKPHKASNNLNLSKSVVASTSQWLNF